MTTCMNDDGTTAPMRFYRTYMADRMRLPVALEELRLLSNRLSLVADSVELADQSPAVLRQCVQYIRDEIIRLEKEVQP